MLWVTEGQAHQEGQHELVETEGHEEGETGGGGQEEVETGGGEQEVEEEVYLHLAQALWEAEAGYLHEAGNFDSIAGQLCSSYGAHHSMILFFCRDFQWFVKVDLFAVGLRF